MDKSCYKNMWVHIEHENGKVSNASLELCCEVRRLCDESGDKLIGVAAGSIPESEMQRIKECGADGVISVSGTGYDRYSTEAYSNLYVELSRKYLPSAVFIAATANGRDFAPHFAACLETGCTSDATELIYNPETKDIEFVEPAAGGKIMAVITIPVLRPQVGTIRPGTFKLAPGGCREDFEVIREHIDFDLSKIRTKLLERIASEFDPELDIASCETIVCIGNGVKDESLGKYRELARLLGGKLAGTRPVRDRELLPVKLQVGQSGVMIKPKLYLGFGISGAVNHVTGVDADMLIAVNTDKTAPIFNYCDYGIVGDMDEVCDELIAALS